MRYAIVHLQVDFRWSQVHHRWTFGGVPCASLWQSLRHTLSPSAVMLSDFWASTAPSSFVTRLCFLLQQQIVMLLLTHLSFHSHLAAPIIQRLYDIQANICSPSKPSHHPPIWPTHLMHPSIHLHPSALIAFHPTIHPSAQLKCNILLFNVTFLTHFIIKKERPSLIASRDSLTNPILVVSFSKSRSWRSNWEVTQCGHLSSKRFTIYQKYTEPNVITAVVTAGQSWVSKNKKPFGKTIRLQFCILGCQTAS